MQGEILYQSIWVEERVTAKELILLPLVGAGLSAFLTWWLCRPGSRFYTLDHPNERSLHTSPTPRTGGIAIVAVCVLLGTALLIYSGEETRRFIWLGIAMLLLATTSFLDDRLGLAAGGRLLVHLIVATTLLAGGFVVDAIELPGTRYALPLFVAAPLTLLFIAWMVNLYNFMDGMDGFAGGMAVAGFGTYALLGIVSGQYLFAGMNLIVAAAAGGFLLFNFPRARIFMGDTGSSSLGLLAAAFTMWGVQIDVFDSWIGLLVFSPFIVDATVTLLRRFFRGEKIWQAHKAHYYQRVVQSGWGHRRTVLWAYVLMAACAASAVAALRLSVSMQWVMIGCWIVAYLMMALGVRRLERVQGSARQVRES